MKPHTPMSVVRLSGLCVLLGLLLGGCTVRPGLHVSENASATAAGYRVVGLSDQVASGTAITRAMPPVAPLFEPVLPGVRSELDYRVGPGDVLTVVVWDHPELTNPTGGFRDAASSGQLVGADGMMFYPHVGTFDVAGKTTGEIRAFLVERLQRVIRKPQIDVRVAAFRSQRIQVSGEVRAPGVVTLDDTAKGVIEAVTERGGLTPQASQRQLLLQRGDTVHRVDIAALLAGSGAASNPRIMAGDVIHVPDASIDRVSVMGEVRNSAPVSLLQQGLTLTEALTTVGGLDRLTARDSGVLVFRRGQEVLDRVPTIFVLDLGRPQGMITASEFRLAPRDVVYVKATDFSKYNAVISQLLPTISAVFQLDRLIND